MIPINLLPHRAERRKAQQRQFVVLVSLVALLGGLVWFSGHQFFQGRIENQERRNQFLETRIAELDKQIDEIKKLKEQTQALLARKRVVESLQTNRTESVRLLDQLVRQLPEGVYLKSIKQTGARVNVIGYATSNARVSTLMRNFEASPWLEAPQLVEIKASKVGDQTLNEFNLFVSISRPKEQTTPAQSRPAAAPANPAAAQPKA
ncbi:MAG TPA: PilN domain-containing protein [Burkholderiales bacterium]|nr:PilN domain-containing protein [Burkholderiales bacterium]